MCLWYVIKLVEYVVVHWMVQYPVLSGYVQINYDTVTTDGTTEGAALRAVTRTARFSCPVQINYSTVTTDGTTEGIYRAWCSASNSKIFLPDFFIMYQLLYTAARGSNRSEWNLQFALHLK